MTFGSDEMKILDKKNRTTERLINELQTRVNEAETGLGTSQKEARSLSSELFKTKNAYDEAIDATETIKRENKNLAEEICDLTDQLAETSKNLDAIDKQKRANEASINELQGIV